MAKKRRVALSKAATANDNSADRVSVSSSAESSTPPTSASGDVHSQRLEPAAIAAALLAGSLVYVTYHPSDSVAVERGNALWFAVIAIVTATIALARFGFQGRLWGEARRWSIAVDALAFGLAVWMMLAAFATCPPGNLRMATNEAWLWVSGAAVFMASRRLMNSISVRRALFGVMIACSVAVAVHALHQQWYSLPQSRAEYRADPEKLLAAAQIVAPQGSVERMIFENRLFDGGPTGTFALANSMAGFLVVGCLMLAGVLRTQWLAMRKFERAGLSVLLSIGLLSLWMARSRSATLACVLGIVTVTFVVPWLVGVVSIGDSSKPTGIGAGTLGSKTLGSGTLGSKTLGSRTLGSKILRRLFVGLGAIFAAVVGVIGLVAAVGHKEWFEQAPASLAFRLQYWRSTWAMAVDAPWFGAGPGNFQSIYQRYREDSASEEIADAHNFLFETLAAGGFVGGLLLVALFAAAFVFVRRRLSVPVTNESPETQTDDMAKWVWLGGGLSLLMIWLLGAAAGRTPDFQAHMIAVPISIAAAYFCWPAVRRIHWVAIDLLAVVAIASLLVHLLAAGGWTIPGVAMPIWLFAGMLARTQQQGPCEDELPARRIKTAVAIVCIGGAVLLSHRIISLAPVEGADRAMKAADFARSEDQLSAMNRAVDKAVQADTWAVDASLYKSDLLRWELVYRGDRPVLRKRWMDQLDETLRRGGENPTLFRSAAQQILHVYQRFGRREDLVLADQRLQQAGFWSPADHALLAQRAATTQALGQFDLAQRLSQRAARLAELGDNIERQLFRQMIYVVKPLGKSAENGPRLAPATEVLAEQLEPNQSPIPGVTTQN